MDVFMDLAIMFHPISRSSVTTHLMEKSFQKRESIKARK